LLLLFKTHFLLVAGNIGGPMVLFIVANSKAGIGMAKVLIRFPIDPHTLANGSRDGIMVLVNVFGRCVID
jgi:hypothetical protein